MYIDPELNIAREELLTKVPGGFNAPVKIEDRRALLEEFLGAVPLNVNVDREDIFIPGPDGAPEVRIRIYRPRSGMWSKSALMVIHGGGMVSGSIEANDSSAAFLCETLGVLTMAVGYRLAPEYPFPAGIEDCHSAARWFFTNAESLGVDSEKISLYGGSAGGGLAIGLTLLLRDRNQPNFAFILAAYPMLDDRNITESSQAANDVGVWDRKANLESWSWYLSETYGTDDVSIYAAPARAKDLSGLPPIFMDVGSADSFRDEDQEFAVRLFSQGNSGEFHLFSGAFHSAELFAPQARVSQRIWATRIAALLNALS